MDVADSGAADLIEETRTVQNAYFVIYLQVAGTCYELLGQFLVQKTQ